MLDAPRETASRLSRPRCSHSARARCQRPSNSLVGVGVGAAALMCLPYLLNAPPTTEPFPMRRIGVDVGGTFTDVVVLDEESGSTSWLKLPTNAREPAVGVLEAMAASGVPLSEVSHVKVGTTLGVNAVLTRSGACTGLITTRGFRYVLEIRRPHRTRLFDPDEQLPEPLVPRDRRLEVSERMDADGHVVAALDEEGVRAAWRELRAAGVTSLAIVFLFSFENPEHEQRARDIVLR